MSDANSTAPSAPAKPTIRRPKHCRARQSARIPRRLANGHAWACCAPRTARPADQRPVSKDAVTEMGLHPFVVVDRIDIAFSEVRRDGHRGEILRAVLLQPVDGGEDHRARGAAKQESIFG